MPVAIVLALILIGAVAVLGASTMMHTPQRIAQTHDAQASWLAAYISAANAFAQQNHGFSGSIDDASVMQFMGPYQGLLGPNGTFAKAGVQYGAALINGDLVVWANPPSGSSGTTYLTGLKSSLKGNLSGIYIKNGASLTSPVDGQVMASPF